jgi:NitT/TauT family transport system ATP-binding protein
MSQTPHTAGGSHGDVEISIEGVWQKFQRLESSAPFVALQDINVVIDYRRFVAVVGLSGCGKSTLLRIIAGLIQPTRGQVMHRGRVVDGPHYSRGFVFQADAVFPWLTVRGNLEFGLRSRGIERPARRKIADHWCDVVGLTDFIDAYPKELSGGMRKRVDLARVYANDPDVLLMDEPFGALDAQTKERMQGELLEIWERSKKTVVFVTHDVDEAVFLADEVLIMSSRPGRIAARVPIDLTRERTEDTRVSDEFAEYRRSIRQMMRELDRQHVSSDDMRSHAHATGL